MKHFFGKKQVMLATLAVALGLAVYLNYYFAGKDLSPQTSGSSTTAKTTVATGGNLGDSQYVNGSTTVPDDRVEASATTAAGGLAYFTNARKNRENARTEALEILKELANDVKSSQAVIDDATAKIVAVAKAVEQESKIEELIKAKGFADCVAYIEEENCSVVVQSEALTAAQTLQITEIVSAQSSVLSQNVKITCINS